MADKKAERVTLDYMGTPITMEADAAERMMAAGAREVAKTERKAAKAADKTADADERASAKATRKDAAPASAPAAPEADKS